MKSTNIILLAAKIIAVTILVAYAIGLFRTYDTLQASIMLVIAAILSLELVFMAKQASKDE